MERGKAMNLAVGPFALFCGLGGSGGASAYIATLCARGFEERNMLWLILAQLYRRLLVSLDAFSSRWPLLDESKAYHLLWCNNTSIICFLLNVGPFASIYNELIFSSVL